MKKIVEKLEININEYNVKIQEMNKAILTVTSEKTKLQQDNTDTVRRMNELKHSIDTAGLDKNKLAAQLKEFQENIDALNRAKAGAENGLPDSVIHSDLETGMSVQPLSTTCRCTSFIAEAIGGSSFIAAATGGTH